jgi:hypothetical protein
VFTLIKGGDHRLSRPEDIERLLARLGSFDGTPQDLEACAAS